MSWYSYSKDLPDHVRFTQTWGNKPGIGKYWKTKLHKARRRYWREMIQSEFWRGVDVDRDEWMYTSFDAYPPNLPKLPHPRDPSYYESTVNWRSW